MDSQVIFDRRRTEREDESLAAEWIDRRRAEPVVIIRMDCLKERWNLSCKINGRRSWRKCISKLCPGKQSLASEWIVWRRDETCLVKYMEEDPEENEFINYVQETSRYHQNGLVEGEQQLLLQLHQQILKKTGWHSGNLSLAEEWIAVRIAKSFVLQLRLRWNWKNHLQNYFRNIHLPMQGIVRKCAEAIVFQSKKNKLTPNSVQKDVFSRKELTGKKNL